MKRICTLCLFACLMSTNLLWSQQGKSINYSESRTKSFTMPEAPEVRFRMEMDTLFPPSFDEECSNDVISYTITDMWGNVSGMNEFIDLQKAQRFDYNDAATFTVNEVGVFFSRADIVGDGELKINIYDVGPGGGPSALLGSSETINASDIVIPGEDDPLLPTLFTFNTPPLVNSNRFFVSVDFTELYNSQDTVALYNTVEDCGDGASTWELFSDGTTWDNYVNTWSLNTDLALFTVVEKQEDIVLNEVDTAFTPSFLDTCSNTVTAFGVDQGWGWVSGTNNFGDLEKAQRFDFPGGEAYNVTQVAVFFNDAEVVGDGNVSVKIYNAAGDGSPGQLLGTSAPLKVSELVVSDQEVLPTFFTFDENVMLTDSRFFASVDLSGVYDTQDTVGIFNTRVDCGSGASTWELFSDGASWVPYSDVNSWQIDVDLFIFTVLEQMNTGIDDLSPEEAGLHLTNAFPNPARDQLTLDYRLDQSENISISIHHASGQLIQNLYLGRRSQGQHQETLTLKDLSNGVYYYTFATGKTRVMRKFVVQK